MSDVARTYARVLRDSAAQYSGEAIADGGVSFTFEALLEDVRRVAAALIAKGIGRGDRVAVWAPNSHWWVRFSEAVHYVGAVVVPVNTRYRATEARDLLNRTAARGILIHDGFLGFDYLAALSARVVDAEAAAVDHLEFVVDIAGGLRPSPREGLQVHGWESFVALGDSIPDMEVDACADEVEADDLGDILFTSGTTGHAKGVEFRQGGVIDLYRDYGEIWGLVAGDRYLVSLPMFHAGGNKAGILTCLLHGMTIVPMAVFDPAEMLGIIERERISVLNGPPTVIYALLDDPRRSDYDISTLRAAATGAAVVPVAMVERVQHELPFEHFITAYGMTECYGTATMCRVGDSRETIANTNGRALPKIELKVVGLDGEELSTGEQGELLIKAPNVTSGYWQDPGQTVIAIRDGWLHTGDIGTIDDHGNLKITDRLKDMFMVGGFNVSPAEIEQALARHPDVAEVSVVGVPDERLGEVARAFVIGRRGATPDEAEIIGWCRERLANFKVPRAVVVVEALPRNTQGKVMKAELRATATTDGE